ncbi:hypothetical protein [Brevibacillus sp. SYSU BS000544]|uniref:hypothetical protein n=1 Tax=Brevibacillus sp. SYSU BS000544 TaxID=3416443 RepID=UPI003CE50778
MKKLVSKLMVGAVVLSVLAPSASYAANTIENSNTATAQVQQENKRQVKQMTAEERQANHEKLMEIIKKYTPELADQFQAIFDEQEANRAKMDEIREQVKAGTLTKEEAQAKLKELGLDFGDRGFGHKGFGGKELDEATKAKVDEIREQVKAGTLTKEEAQAKLKELGLDFGPGFCGHKDGHNGHFAQLDEAVTNNDEAKVKEILTQMLADLQARNKTNN